MSVPDHFFLHNLKDVQIVFLGQKKGVDQDVGQLFLKAINVYVFDLVFFLPQNPLVKFGSLEHQRQ